MSRKKSSEPAEKKLSKFDKERIAAGMEPETKADKFSRLANMRVLRTVKAVKNVGQLANRQTYEYTKEQAALTVKLLQDAVDSVRQKFQGSVANDTLPRI